MDKQFLIDFESNVAERFNNREIRAPIHLYHGCEDAIINIFKNIDIKNDWVCCTWRNHYQALLKGVPSELLMEKIIKGKSMVMNLPEYKFVCSSIVGGIPSIATGLAMAARLSNSSQHVWCWTGDMSAETGAWHEAYKYSVNHELPITFVVEDNNASVLTPTPDIWNRHLPYYVRDQLSDSYPIVENEIVESSNLLYYRYTNTKYPHAGAGIRVQF